MTRRWVPAAAADTRVVEVAGVEVDDVVPFGEEDGEVANLALAPPHAARTPASAIEAMAPALEGGRLFLAEDLTTTAR
jgi:hypothetical protein